MNLPEGLIGHVVEFWRVPASVRTGIVGNLPKERCIALISHIKSADYEDILVAYDADSHRASLSLFDITADLGPAKAGWGSW